MKRFSSRLEGTSNRTYGTKLPTTLVLTWVGASMRTYKMTRAVLYSLPPSFRSCFKPNNEAFPILTLEKFVIVKRMNRPRPSIEHSTYRSKKASRYRAQRTGTTLISILLSTLLLLTSGWCPSCFSSTSVEYDLSEDSESGSN